MCAHNGMTLVEFWMNILGFLMKFVRSVFFNIFILIIGFICGFGTMHMIAHIEWKRNPNYESLENLQSHLKDQRKLDDNIDHEIDSIKLRLIHEKYHGESK